MLEEKISKKRKELDESIKNNKNYEDVYKLSIELDDLITEFYKDSILIRKQKRLRIKKRRRNKILYMV